MIYQIGDKVKILRPVPGTGVVTELDDRIVGNDTRIYVKRDGRKYLGSVAYWADELERI